MLFENDFFHMMRSTVLLKFVCNWHKVGLLWLRTSWNESCRMFEEVGMKFKVGSSKDDFIVAFCTHCLGSTSKSFGILEITKRDVCHTDHMRSYERVFCAFDNSVQAYMKTSFVRGILQRRLFVAWWGRSYSYFCYHKRTKGKVDCPFQLVATCLWQLLYSPVLQVTCCNLF